MSVQASIPVLYRYANLDGVITDCNQLYAERLGYSIKEVLGTSILDHVPDEIRDQIWRVYLTWKNTFATNVSHKIQLQARDGEIVDVIRTIRNVYENGKVIGASTNMRTMSDIKAMQDLYNVKTRDGYEDPHIMRRSVDYIGTIVDCSQSYLDNLGYTKDEVIGISLYEHTAPRSKGSLHANMENWRHGRRDKAKIWMLRRDGSQFPTLLGATSETDKNGMVVGRTVSIEMLDE